MRQWITTLQHLNVSNYNIKASYHWSDKHKTGNSYWTGNNKNGISYPTTKSIYPKILVFTSYHHLFRYVNMLKRHYKSNRKVNLLFADIMDMIYIRWSRLKILKIHCCIVYCISRWSTELLPHYSFNFTLDEIFSICFIFWWVGLNFS